MKSFEIRGDKSAEHFESTHAEKVERERLNETDFGYQDQPLWKFREKFPGEYIETWEKPVTSERFPAPAHIVGEINPKYRKSPSYRVNSADCARAVEKTWRGHRETAAGRRILQHESPERMESWAGQPFRSLTLKDIHDRVEDAGHGSSAIIESRYSTLDGEPASHVYNVVNDHGAVKVIDGQIGRVYSWDFLTGHPELGSVSDFHGTHKRSMAMGWDADRRPLW